MAEEKTKDKLLGDKTPSVDLDKVLEKIRRDPFAFYDEKKKVREVPIFAYEDNEPVSIIRWQKRHVAETLKEAQLNAWDFYHQTRGWIREGRKAERDYDYTPDFNLEEN